MIIDSLIGLLQSKKFNISQGQPVFKSTNILNNWSTYRIIAHDGQAISNGLSSWPYGITYFWLLGQVLCEAQRREHSLSYVTGVVTKHDCMDAGARATQEQLP